MCRETNPKVFPHHQQSCSTSRIALVSPLKREKNNVQIVEENNQIQFIACRSELSAEEKLASFFSDAEYAAFRQREKDLSREIAIEQTIKPQPWVKLEIGLQSRHDKYLRRQRINECIISVLLEQELHELAEESIDPTRIAFIVHGYSFLSAKLAYDRAYENALQVGQQRPWPTIPSSRSRHPSTPRPASPTSVKFGVEHYLPDPPSCQQDYQTTTHNDDDVTLVAAFEPPRLKHRLESSTPSLHRWAPFPPSALPRPRTSYYLVAPPPPPPPPRPFPSIHFQTLPTFPARTSGWSVPLSSQARGNINASRPKAMCTSQEEDLEFHWMV